MFISKQRRQVVTFFAIYLERGERVTDLVTRKLRLGADRTRQALNPSDVRCPRSCYYGSRVAVPTPRPTAPAPAVWVNQNFCAPGPRYILKLGPSGTDMVPVQSGA